MPSQPPPGLDKIKHVVVLMFENRSFDHLFGDFPNVDGLFENGQPKPDCYNTANPLIPPDPTKNPAFWPVPIDATRPLPHDFTHDFGDGMMPDLFGPIFSVVPSTGLPQPNNPNATYLSGYVAGQPTNVSVYPPTTYPAQNSGFYSTYNSAQPQGATALSYFKKGDLKALHTLADNFVLCDNWYCDTPGHTEPNRCFMHCATTGSVGIDDPDNGQNTAPTIFDRLDAANLSWNMYAPAQFTPWGTTTLGQLDTRFLNDNVELYPGVPLTQFATDCQNHTLPRYSFIMCWLAASDVWTDTSMHPNSLIQPGENLLAAVYNTLRGSPHWDDTLLVVNFDENGGIYDHKFPPGTQPPKLNRDGTVPVIGQNAPGCCGNAWYLASRFDYSLLGVRIPAMLISPWLNQGVDSTQYQNTSVVRFLIDLINQWAPGTSQPYLTRRDANATSIENVFTNFGTNTMRDCPKTMPTTATMPGPAWLPYKLPYGAGTLNDPVYLPDAVWKSRPVPYIPELLTMYLRRLHGHPDSGGKVTRTFLTVEEVLAYTEERMQAAKQGAPTGPKSATVAGPT